MTWFRRRQVRPEGSLVSDGEAVLELVASSQASPETQFDERLSQKVVAKALESLDPKYREVLVLRFFEHKEYEEISDILQIPVGSVGTLLHRGKKQLATVLNQQAERINE